MVLVSDSASEDFRRQSRAEARARRIRRCGVDFACNCTWKTVIEATELGLVDSDRIVDPQHEPEASCVADRAADEIR